MPSQNQVVRKGNIVVKTFASHLNYLRESSIYEKLEGSGLAPRVLYSGSDSIEHEYVEGETLEALIESSRGNAAQLAHYFRLFFDWYSVFREKTGNCIENISFSKFIYSDEKLCCVDFEHCRPDFAEKDIASLAAAISLSHEPFSFRSMELCRLFICVGAGVMSWDPARLEKFLSQELSAKTEKQGIEFNRKAADYLLQSAVTCGVIFADDLRQGDSSAVRLLSTLPQRIVLRREAGGKAFPSFETLETGLSPVDSLNSVSELLKLVRQPWCLWMSASESYSAETVSSLLSAEKEGFDALIAAKEGTSRIFPMLVRTDTLQAAIGKALASGTPGLTHALKALNIKYTL